MKTGNRSCDRYAIARQAFDPVIERSGRDREGDINNLPCAPATFWSAGPGKEGHDGTRRADLITIVEMIGARIIKVDGLLDQALPQNTGIKIDILLWISHDRCEMMKPTNSIVIQYIPPRCKFTL